MACRTAERQERRSAAGRRRNGRDYGRLVLDLFSHYLLFDPKMRGL
jgi:hypothetical protein